MPFFSLSEMSWSGVFARRVGARARVIRPRRLLCAGPTPSSHVESLCDDVCKLNVIELGQFLELFKERAGLKDSDMMSAAPVAMAAAPAGAPADASEDDAPAAKAKEFFDLKLTGFDAKSKVKIIKEVRAITGLGLKESKEVVEGVPSVLKKEIKEDEGKELVKKLSEYVFLSFHLSHVLRGARAGLVLPSNSNKRSRALTGENAEVLHRERIERGRETVCVFPRSFGG